MVAAVVLAGGVGATGHPTRPDEVEACAKARRHHARAELDRIEPEVEALVGTNFTSLGGGDGNLDVELTPGQELLASQLERRYGDAVAITVGASPYCHGIGRSPRCYDQVPGADELPAGMHLRLRLNSHVIAGGEDLRGTLTIRQDGATPLRIDPGQPVVGYVVRRHTRQVVARFTGLIGGTGIPLDLHDGASRTIEVLIGTARCDGKRGSTLPPGRYGVRAGVARNEGRPDYLAPEQELTVRG